MAISQLRLCGLSFRREAANLHLHCKSHDPWPPAKITHLNSGNRIGNLRPLEDRIRHTSCRGRRYLSLFYWMSCSFGILNEICFLSRAYRVRVEQTPVLDRTRTESSPIKTIVLLELGADWWDQPVDGAAFSRVRSRPEARADVYSSFFLWLRC